MIDTDNVIIRQRIHKNPRPFYVVRRLDKNGVYYYILVTPIIKDDKYCFYWWKQTDRMIFFEGVSFVSYSLSQCMNRGWELTENIIQNQIKISWVFA